MDIREFLYNCISYFYVFSLACGKHMLKRQQIYFSVFIIIVFVQIYEANISTICTDFSAVFLPTDSINAISSEVKTAEVDTVRESSDQ